MDTTDDLRRLFMKVVNEAVVYELIQEDQQLRRKIVDAILRLKEAQDHGLIFLYQSYENEFVRQAEINRDDVQALGLVLEDYAQFHHCLICFQGLDWLQKKLRAHGLSLWLKTTSRPRVARPFVRHYFWLLEGLSDEGRLITPKDAERLTTLSDIFDISFPPRLQAWVDLFAEVDEINETVRTGS